MIRRSLTFALLTLPLGSAVAQELPILDPLQTQLILQEVSGDASFEHVRYLTQLHHRARAGSDGLWAAAEYMERMAGEYGLADVHLIKQASTTRPWNARFADLWIVGDKPERLASTLQSALHLVDYSRAADVEAELVDGGGGSDTELDAQDIAGKVVLTHGAVAGVMTRAVCDRGAAGVIVFPEPTGTPSGTVGSAGLGRPDQLRWNHLPSSDSLECTYTFAFNLSTRQGLALRERIAAADEPLRVHALVDAAFTSSQGSEPWQVMVQALIPGTDPAAMQDIVLTGHLQEEATSANDDASGSANLLEIGRALTRLIAEGKIPRPRRNIRLWWVTEIGSERQFFHDSPNAPDTMWVNINQDMVGANQAQDVMRKQNVTRLPASRFHFFNDVVEEIVEFMVASNTYELSQSQAGIPMYPRPHVALRGSEHRFNAATIFFHSNSDHATFLEAPIGIPAVSFTNMPDRFIHSSDDDLWNIDATQLGRSAASVALIAFAMASAGDDDVAVLAASTAGRGMARMGHNLRLALSWIAAAADKAAAYHMASDQVAYAAEREQLAAASLGEIGSSGTAAATELGEAISRRQAQMQREVDLAYRRVTDRRPPRRELSAAEVELQGLQPYLIAGPVEFLAKRDDPAAVDGLHRLMRFEILAAVDRARSGLDIFRYVAAEAREAGAHYYGTVSAEDVLLYLKNLADAELIAMEEVGDQRVPPASR
ncbi:MAG TPA: M28 family peptidase [Gemmatimonadales bacterium]|jgi:hypothetical protein